MTPKCLGNEKVPILIVTHEGRLCVLLAISAGVITQINIEPKELHFCKGQECLGHNCRSHISTHVKNAGRQFKYGY